jgi:hypothetical protein
VPGSGSAATDADSIGASIGSVGALLAKLSKRLDEPVSWGRHKETWRLRDAPLTEGIGGAAGDFQSQLHQVDIFEKHTTQSENNNSRPDATEILCQLSNNIYQALNSTCAGLARNWRRGKLYGSGRVRARKPVPLTELSAVKIDPMPTEAKMQPQQQRVIRVFISSTFRDMQMERDELVKRTFPQLRRLCESRGGVWGEVDLRWGLTDEEAAEGQILPVCLEEIDRCRPFFIGCWANAMAGYRRTFQRKSSKRSPGWRGIGTARLRNWK